MAKNIDSISTNAHKEQPLKAPRVNNQPVSGVSYKTQINLLHSKAEKKPKTILKWIFLLLMFFILLLGAVVVNRAANLSDKIFAGQTTTFFGKIYNVIKSISGKVVLNGENKGQINILLLGIGGQGHQGPFLSDTIILAQIRPKESDIAFISVPRDLLAELPNNLGFRKINSVFSEGYAQNKNWSEAGRWATMAVERLSGQTIPYFAVIDFTGFEKAINEIDGIDIFIEKTFTDSQFPDEKFGYLAPLTFEQGQEHMDGARALQFARSRHGTNGEGSDFARGLRQQKVMKAFKDKVLALNLFTSIGKINGLLEIFAGNFHTNLNPGEILRLYNIAKDQNIQTFLSLNLGLETGLVCPTSHETAGYILVPCEGKTYRDIQAFFKNAFVLGKLEQEKATIWLADSTQNPARLKQAENILKEAGLTVWQLNYNKDDLPQSIAFQVNPKPATLEFIKNALKVKILTLPPPGVKINAEKVDIIVILGISQ